MTQYFVKKVLCLQQKAEKTLRTPKPKLKQCGDLCDKK